MKFIHIADVHLGVQPDKGKPWSEQRAREITETFDKLLSITEEKQADLLLIAGDLFHAPPAALELAELDDKLSKLTRTKTVIIAGNHDYMGKGSAYATYRFQSDTVCFPADRLSSVYFQEMNVCVVGQSYNRQEVFEGIYDEARPVRKDAINILLAHGGDLSHAPINRKKILDAGFDYIALGHIHKPEIIEKDKMAYAGSPEPIDHTDIGDRGYIYGEISDAPVSGREDFGRRSVHIFWKKINTRNYINLALKMKPEYTNVRVVDKLAAEMERLGSRNIYRIILRGMKREQMEFDFRGLTDRFCISAIEDRTRGNIDLEAVLAENRDNLIGQFILQLKDKEDEVSRKALEYGLAALLDSVERTES